MVMKGRVARRVDDPRRSPGAGRETLPLRLQCVAAALLRSHSRQRSTSSPQSPSRPGSAHGI